MSDAVIPEHSPAASDAVSLTIHSPTYNSLQSKDSSLTGHVAYRSAVTAEALDRVFSEKSHVFEKTDTPRPLVQMAIRWIPVTTGAIMVGLSWWIAQSPFSFTPFLIGVIVSQFPVWAKRMQYKWRLRWLTLLCVISGLSLVTKIVFVSVDNDYLNDFLAIEDVGAFTFILPDLFCWLLCILVRVCLGKSTEVKVYTKERTFAWAVFLDVLILLATPGTLSILGMFYVFWSLDRVRKWILTSHESSSHMEVHENFRLRRKCTHILLAWIVNLHLFVHGAFMFFAEALKVDDEQAGAQTQRWLGYFLGFHTSSWTAVGMMSLWFVLVMLAHSHEHGDHHRPSAADIEHFESKGFERNDTESHHLSAIAEEKSDDMYENYKNDYLNRQTDVGQRTYPGKHGTNARSGAPSPSGLTPNGSPQLSPNASRLNSYQLPRQNAIRREVSVDGSEVGADKNSSYHARRRKAATKILTPSYLLVRTFLGLFELVLFFTLDLAANIWAFMGVGVVSMTLCFCAIFNTSWPGCYLAFCGCLVLLSPNPRPPMLLAVCGLVVWVLLSAGSLLRGPHPSSDPNEEIELLLGIDLGGNVNDTDTDDVYSQDAQLDLFARLLLTHFVAMTMYLHQQRMTYQQRMTEIQSSKHVGAFKESLLAVKTTKNVHAKLYKKGSTLQELEEVQKMISTPEIALTTTSNRQISLGDGKDGAQDGPQERIPDESSSRQLLSKKYSNLSIDVDAIQVQTNSNGHDSTDKRPAIDVTPEETDRSRDTVDSRQHFTRSTDARRQFKRERSWLSNMLHDHKEAEELANSLEKVRRWFMRTPVAKWAQERIKPTFGYARVIYGIYVRPAVGLFMLQLCIVILLWELGHFGFSSYRCIAYLLVMTPVWLEPNSYRNWWILRFVASLFFLTQYFLRLMLTKPLPEEILGIPHDDLVIPEDVATNLYWINILNQDDIEDDPWRNLVFADAFIIIFSSLAVKIMFDKDHRAYDVANFDTHDLHQHELEWLLTLRLKRHYGRIVVLGLSLIIIMIDPVDIFSMFYVFLFCGVLIMQHMSTSRSDHSKKITQFFVAWNGRLAWALLILRVCILLPTFGNWLIPHVADTFTAFGGVDLEGDVLISATDTNGDIYDHLERVVVAIHNVNAGTTPLWAFDKEDRGATAENYCNAHNDCSGKVFTLQGGHITTTELGLQVERGTIVKLVFMMMLALVTRWVLLAMSNARQAHWVCVEILAHMAVQRESSEGSSRSSPQSAAMRLSRRARSVPDDFWSADSSNSTPLEQQIKQAERRILDAKMHTHSPKESLGPAPLDLGGGGDDDQHDLEETNAAPNLKRRSTLGTIAHNTSEFFINVKKKADPWHDKIRTWTINFFEFCCEHIPKLLIAVVFLVSIEPELFNLIHTTCALLLLFVGKFWRYAGWFFSVTSLAAFFVQYVCRFTFVSGEHNSHILSPEMLRWTGLEWNSASVARNLVIICLSLFQRVLDKKHYEWRKKTNKKMDVASSPVTVGVVKYGPDIAVCALVLAACMRPTGYALLYFATALIVRLAPSFQSCGKCSEHLQHCDDDGDIHYNSGLSKPPSKRGKICHGFLCAGNLMRLRFCAGVLTLSLFAQTIFLLGPPPGCLNRGDCKPYADMFMWTCSPVVEECDTDCQFWELLNPLQWTKSEFGQTVCLEQFQRWWAVPSNLNGETILRAEAVTIDSNMTFRDNVIASIDTDNVNITSLYVNRTVAHIHAADNNIWDGPSTGETAQEFCNRSDVDCGDSVVQVVGQPTISPAGRIWDFFALFIIAVILRATSIKDIADAAHDEYIGQIKAPEHGLRGHIRKHIKPHDPYFIAIIAIIVAATTNPFFSTVYIGLVVFGWLLPNRHINSVKGFRGLAIALQSFGFFHLFCLLAFQFPAFRCPVVDPLDSRSFVSSHMCYNMTQTFDETRWPLSTTVDGYSGLQSATSGTATNTTATGAASVLGESGITYVSTWYGLITMTLGFYKVDLNNDMDPFRLNFVIALLICACGMYLAVMRQVPHQKAAKQRSLEHSGAELIRALRWVEMFRVRLYLQLEKSSSARLAMKTRILAAVQRGEVYLQELSREQNQESEQTTLISEPKTRDDHAGILAVEIGCHGWSLREIRFALDMFSFRPGDFIPSETVEGFLQLYVRFIEGNLCAEELLSCAKELQAEFLQERAGVSREEAVRALEDCDWHGDLAFDAIQLAKEKAKGSLNPREFRVKVTEILRNVQERLVGYDSAKVSAIDEALGAPFDAYSYSPSGAPANEHAQNALKKIKMMKALGKDPDLVTKGEDQNESQQTEGDQQPLLTVPQLNPEPSRSTSHQPQEEESEPFDSKESSKKKSTKVMNHFQCLQPEQIATRRAVMNAGGYKPQVIGLRRLATSIGDQFSGEDQGGGSIMYESNITKTYQPPSLTKKYLLKFYFAFREFLVYHINDLIFGKQGASLSDHRQNDGIIKLSIKAFLSHSFLWISVIAAIAFVINQSIFDAVRVLIVIGAGLRAYPIPPTWILKFAAIYSILLLVIRILYQLQLWCATPFQIREYSDFPQYYELGFIAPCSPPGTGYWDRVIGLRQTDLSNSFGAWWADAVFIVFMAIHIACVKRQGLWHFVKVDEQGQVGVEVPPDNPYLVYMLERFFNDALPQTTKTQLDISSAGGSKDDLSKQGSYDFQFDAKEDATDPLLRTLDGAEPRENDPIGAVENLLMGAELEEDTFDAANLQQDVLSKQHQTSMFFIAKKPSSRMEEIVQWFVKRAGRKRALVLGLATDDDNNNDTEFQHLEQGTGHRRSSYESAAARIAEEEQERQLGHHFSHSDSRSSEDMDMPDLPRPTYKGSQSVPARRGMQPSVPASSESAPAIPHTREAFLRSGSVEGTNLPWHESSLMSRLFGSQQPDHLSHSPVRPLGNGSGSASLQNPSMVRFRQSQQDLDDISAQDSCHDELQEEVPKRSWMRILFDIIVPDGSIRKPGNDLYVWTFILGFSMFLVVIIFLHDLTGEGSLLESVSKSYFNSKAVMLITFHTLVIVTDRCFYRATFKALLARQFEISPEEENWKHATGAMKKSDSEGTVSLDQDDIPALQSPMRNDRIFDSELKKHYTGYLGAMTLKSILTFLEFVGLHIFFIAQVIQIGPGSQWGQDVGLQYRAADLLYYFIGLSYLAVQLWQLHEGPPRVYRDSLRPAPRYRYWPDMGSRFRFATYRGLPFADEFRIIIDWTVTRTSLDLFQYFTLESAHSDLWYVKMKMLVRMQMYPAESRPVCEKFWFGYCSILGLVVIVLLPVLIFSSFSPLGEGAGYQSANLQLVATLKRPAEGQNYRWTLFHDQVVAQSGAASDSSDFFHRGTIETLEGSELDEFLSARWTLCQSSEYSSAKLCEQGTREVVQVVTFDISGGPLAFEGLGPPSVAQIEELLGDDQFAVSELDLSWQLTLSSSTECNNQATQSVTGGEVSNVVGFCDNRIQGVSGVCATSSTDAFSASHFGVHLGENGVVQTHRPYHCSTAPQDMTYLKDMLKNLAQLSDADRAHGNPYTGGSPANCTADRPSGTVDLPGIWPAIAKITDQGVIHWQVRDLEVFLAPKLRLDCGMWEAFTCEQEAITANSLYTIDTETSNIMCKSGENGEVTVEDVPEDEDQGNADASEDGSGSSEQSSTDDTNSRYTKRAAPVRLIVVSETNTSDLISGMSFTVAGLYISVVFVVSRMLRGAFQNSTFKIIYDEIPQPDILIQMCNAIDASRLYGDLLTEFRLYNALMKFLRSPTILLKLGGPDLVPCGLYRTDPDPSAVTVGDQRIDNADQSFIRVQAASLSQNFHRQASSPV